MHPVHLVLRHQKSLLSSRRKCPAIRRRLMIWKQMQAVILRYINCFIRKKAFIKGKEGRKE